MITLDFQDFKTLAEQNNYRIYYYQMSNILEVAFIVEGMFCKSFIDLNTISNKESFFSDKMWVGSMKLLFRLPSDETKIGFKDMSNQTPIDITYEDVVEEFMPLETDLVDADLQKDGVN